MDSIFRVQVCNFIHGNRLNLTNALEFILRRATRVRPTISLVRFRSPDLTLGQFGSPIRPPALPKGLNTNIHVTKSQ